MARHNCDHGELHFEHMTCDVVLNLHVQRVLPAWLLIFPMAHAVD